MLEWIRDSELSRFTKTSLVPRLRPWWPGPTFGRQHGGNGGNNGGNRTRKAY